MLPVESKANLKQQTGFNSRTEAKIFQPSKRWRVCAERSDRRASSNRTKERPMKGSVVGLARDRLMNLELKGLWRRS